MQQAEAEAGEESSDEEVSGHRQSAMGLDGSDDEPKLSSRQQVPASQEPPTSTKVEDLGSPSGSDEDM